MDEEPPYVSQRQALTASPGRGGHLLGLGADEGVVELGQGVEAGGLRGELLRLRGVALALVRLRQAVEVLRVLLVGLL
jgi:hypothetical protein